MLYFTTDINVCNIIVSYYIEYTHDYFFFHIILLLFLRKKKCFFFSFYVHLISPTKYSKDIFSQIHSNTSYHFCATIFDAVIIFILGIVLLWFYSYTLSWILCTFIDNQWWTLKQKSTKRNVCFFMLKTTIILFCTYLCIPWVHNIMLGTYDSYLIV